MRRWRENKYRTHGRKKLKKKKMVAYTAAQIEAPPIPYEQISGGCYRVCQSNSEVKLAEALLWPLVFRQAQLR